MMKYRGYTGEVVYDNGAHLFHGEVIGTRAVITFQGRSVNELEQAFKDSVDTYLDVCKKRGVEPEKSFSGNLHIRISSKEHERLAQEAMKRNVGLNSFIVEKLTGKE